MRATLASRSCVFDVASNSQFLMSSPYDEPLLEPIREQYASFESTHPSMRLYALIDAHVLYSPWAHGFRGRLRGMPCFPLYGGTGLDDLSESGPVLIACPKPDDGHALGFMRSVMELALRDCRFASWIWSTHEIEPLVAHLQTLLQARLGPDGDEVWFLFYQPAYLAVLHRLLSDEARAYMFGPCLAWWCIDFRHEVIKLAGENLPLPKAWDALPIPEHVANELQRAGSLMQVHAWLKRARPELLNRLFHTNRQLQQVSPHVERALEYGITRKIDLCTYAAYGLLYGERYDDHPALQAILSRAGTCNTTLIDAYAAAGPHVWAEVAETAKQRAAEAAIAAYQQEIRTSKTATVKVWLVNARHARLRNVQIWLIDGCRFFCASLGNIQEAWSKFLECGMEFASASMPVPGERVQVEWWERGVTYCETIVRGELPRAEGEGLAIVTLHFDGRVTVSMHADRPDPAPEWWRLQQP